MGHVALTFALALALSAAACSTAPTAPAAGSSPLLGSWSSTNPGQSSPGTCANFQWSVTQVTGTSASGAFFANCDGTLEVTGTGTGILTVEGLSWSVSGTATGSGRASCAVSATGSARLQADGSILIPYSGSTCLGPISGSQVIARR